MKPVPKRSLTAKRLLALLLMSPILLGGCSRNKALERILESGTITIITRNNAHCYYTYRDQEMGFEYDLARAFADFLGVKLKLTVAKSTDQLFRALESGEADVAAASMAITPSRSKLADFSDGYLTVEQMVITQRKNAGIKSLEDLAGKTLNVHRGSSRQDSLQALRQKGIHVKTKIKRGLPEEDLFEAVSEGAVEAALVASNVALLNRRYYPNVRIAFTLGEPQSIGWAVKTGEKALLRRINEFFNRIRDEGTFEEFYQRYYAYVERFDHLDIKEFIQRIETHLPRYEPIIKEAARRYGFDWRLIAALVYQESQFNPWARSFNGARGLLQLTEPTAEEMGVKNLLNPRENILGGVRYLKSLRDLYYEPGKPDRTLIALAAYNVGKGHIIDARELARDMDLDPNKWASLEKTLPLLQQPKYYEASKYGYCRGGQPVYHVRNIATYYDILKWGAIKHDYETKSHL
jgi:membrane-bound lytic murein transglycosylase F